jgi:hypothetical protein
MSTPNPLKMLCFFSFCLCYLLSTIFLPFILFLSCPLHSTTALLYLIVIFWLFLKICEKMLPASPCFCRRFYTIARSDYYLRHVCQSVFPRGTTRFLLNGFLLNLILEYISKICRENIHFVKISQEQNVHRMKTYVHL